MRLGARQIGTGPAFVVAEAGSAHQGELEKAFQLIDCAAQAGADGVKFQAIYADEILHPLTGEIELPGGRVALYRTFQELERGQEFYARIKDYSERQDLFFLCSVFGIRSSRLLRSLGARALKIASPELNHYPLLREVSSYGLPLILSTGLSTLGDIEKSLAIVGDRVVLLHCITAYPAPEEEYNLKLIANLRALFGVSVGVSDHSADPILVPGLAVLSGACLIEKHLTLSRDGGGVDDPIALEPGDFKKMVGQVRALEGEKREDGLRLLERQYGPERVARVLGSGIKRLAPSEASCYRTTRRSIHAAVTIPSGQMLDRDKLCVVRSERNLRPGLEPDYLELILGCTARRTIPAGQGVVWEDLL